MSRRTSGTGQSDGQAAEQVADVAAIINVVSSPPPRALSDIPGLGPIRVRALQKAGLGDLGVLRSTNLETLLSVPGLTEIKARHIQQFLEPFLPADLVPRPLQPDAPESASQRPFTDDVAHSEGSESGSGAAQVVQRATRVMGEVITVLLSPQAPEFRSRFLRILGQLSQCAESLATDAAHLSEEQQSRAIRRLRRAAKALSEFTDSIAADKKAQGRLADTLEELTAKLAECRLSS